MEDDSRQRVGLVPISIFQHADCGCEEQGIYGFMSTHACRRGYLWLGLATIAEAVKLDRGKVRRRLEKLIALGFVERMPHPDPEIRCWMYRLIGHDQILNGLLGENSRPDDGLSQTLTVKRDSTANPRHDEHEHHKHLTEESLSHARSEAGEPEVSLGISVGAGKAKAEQDKTATVTPAPLAASWVPSPSDMAFADAVRRDLTPQDVARIAEKFVRHYGGQNLPDPSSIFRSWLRKEIKFDVRNNQHHSGRPATSGTSDHHRHARSGKPAGLAERNRAAADDCLRRILVRRAEHSSP
jgi:hypothetical protein